MHDLSPDDSGGLAVQARKDRARFRLEDQDTAVKLSVSVYSACPLDWASRSPFPKYRSEFYQPVLSTSSSNLGSNAASATCIKREVARQGLRNLELAL